MCIYIYIYILWIYFQCRHALTPPYLVSTVRRFANDDVINIRRDTGIYIYSVYACPIARYLDWFEVCTRILTQTYNVVHDSSLCPKETGEKERKTGRCGMKKKEIQLIGKPKCLINGTVRAHNIIYHRACRGRSILP